MKRLEEIVHEAVALEIGQVVSSEYRESVAAAVASRVVAMLLAEAGEEKGPDRFLYFPWRTGTKQGRTVYADDGVNSRPDLMLGSMDTPALARHVVQAHNEWIDKL